MVSGDATRVLIAGGGGTARIRDALTREQIAWEPQQLPDGEFVVWSLPDRELIHTGSEAWRAG